MDKRPSTYIIPSLFIVGLCIIYLLSIKGGLIPVLLFSILPIAGIVIGVLFKQQYTFYAFYIVNYFIMGVSRYIDMKTGMVMLGLTLGLVILIFLKNIFLPYDWKKGRNFLVLMWGIWFLYCFFELFNLMAVTEAWTISINGYALFPFISAIIIPILFTRFKDMQWLLVIWAILTMLAAAKGYWQRNRGFDPAELYWLFVEGGARTHIIYTGIRYFSFFSDAGSFGVSMGLSATVFGIISLNYRMGWMKLLCWVTVISSIYGLAISGTRSAVIVPLTGLVIYILLCRNIRHIVIGGITFTFTFLFLTQTNIGNGNQFIRRMRSAFNKEDASLQVRYINRTKIAPLLQDLPFGIGLGLSGGKATRFQVDTPLAKLPPDSSHVAYWIETGIVGLVLYLTIIFLILLRATWLAVFEVQNKKLRGILLAFIAGISGVQVAAYASDIVFYPNGVILCTLFALLFSGPYYDKELSNDKPTA